MNASSASTQSRPHWDRILSCAQQNNSDEIHRLVLEENVSPNHSNQIQQSALHVASLWGNIEAVQALLSHSANVKAQNQITGASPLHSCVQSSKVPAMNRFHCAKMLIDAGADLHLKDLYGLSPLDCLEAEIERIGSNLDNDYIDATRDLLLGGADQLEKRLAVIPFVLAQNLDLNGLEEVFKGVDEEAAILVDERHPKSGKTALLLAIERLTGNEDGHLDEMQMGELFSMIQFLLREGSDVNVLPHNNTSKKNNETAAPLYLTCKALSSELANANADTIVLDQLERLVLSLLSKGALITAPILQIMHDAARRGYVNVIKFWVESMGIDPNVKGRQGLTSLHFAARSGKAEVVKLILSYSTEGCEILDDGGKTALYAAQVNRKDEVVAILLSANRT